MNANSPWGNNSKGNGSNSNNDQTLSRCKESAQCRNYPCVAKDPRAFIEQYGLRSIRKNYRDLAMDRRVDDIEAAQKALTYLEDFSNRFGLVFPWLQARRGECAFFV